MQLPGVAAKKTKSHEISIKILFVKYSCEYKYNRYVQLQQKANHNEYLQCNYNPPPPPFLASARNVEIWFPYKRHLHNTNQHLAKKMQNTFKTKWVRDVKNIVTTNKIQ